MLFAAVGLAPVANADPTGRPKNAAVKTYIIKTKTSLAAKALAVDVDAAGGQIKNRYKRVYPGFAAELTAAQVRAVKRDPQVESITADGVVHSTTSQTNPTWGLDRVDQRPTAGDGEYRYASTGAGVTAYIVDTGIRFSHREFHGSAVSGYDFVDDDADASDCDGHGTHVAGTVGGATYGVAKGVKLVSVRVLDCAGSGTVSGVIAGIDWVATHHSGPSVLNMSLGGGADDALDQAVAAASADGVSVVVAAGNDYDNACYSSPAGAPSAITVGATDARDDRAEFSNAGPCVDLFAPGLGVRSSWGTSDTATSTISGTSMATPHVSGIASRYLQRHPSATPSQVAAAIRAAATRGTVGDPQGAPNLLAYVAPSLELPGKTVIRKASSGSTSGSLVSLTARWAKPATGGAVAKYYVTAIRKSTGTKKTVIVSSATLSKKITGLRKNASYVIRVYARNATGNGVNSSLSNTIKAR
ncbi:MAG TPA: S8 family serine peptidase [Propionibacteriaceae bacterium]|nr:S8 family serine peptidase [Propionibacteriaceae bacterium]